MTRIRPDDSVEPIYFDVFGVTARFMSTEPTHHLALMADYAPFQVERLDTCDVELRVILGQLPPATPETIIGSLGDHLDVRADTLTLIGPRVGDSDAYVTELRPYFTGSILRLLVARQRVQQIHASVVGTPHGAVVFAGPKKSGKTSLALLSVATGRAYKSNDISFLRLSEDGKHVDAFGLPQSLTVGLGAQDWFARHLPDLGMGATQDGMTASDLYFLEIGEKKNISRAEVESFAAVEARPSPLSAIVFPEPNMNRALPRIRELSKDEAAMRLSMLAEVHLRWGLPPMIDRRRFFDTLTTVITQATTQARCFHLQWCHDHNENLRLLEAEVFR
jgi:hypothetical protein